MSDAEESKVVDTVNKFKVGNDIAESRKGVKPFSLIVEQRLESYDWQDQRFITFLSNATHGLIFKKRVKRITGDRFVDEDIMEASSQ